MKAVCHQKNYTRCAPWMWQWRLMDKTDALSADVGTWEQGQRGCSQTAESGCIKILLPALGYL